MTENKRICVAKITTAHGIKGLVKLHVYAEDLNLIKGALFTSETGDETLKITPKNATARHWLAAVDGITERNGAEALRGTSLYIEQTALPEIGDNEFYYADLIGLPAIDEDGMTIGEIIAVENFGASDLLDIKPKGQPSFYLPVCEETLMTINKDNVIIRIPEGLLD
ncbi:MAG: 16S rRNA processing protein RimM [Alphaproteobacteria bacterium]|nr:16S rRNA processing protein RimM [Alphaproteobacteria bacterium]NCQ87788.1 16S rRNA processing protein RimM [Alphaproteobacteria bacterium]NCT05704.1 16S rRNA processing protein RimM [Alphaproteobacteria bacterium]